MVVQCEDIEDGSRDGSQVDLTAGQDEAAIHQAVLLVEILQPLLCCLAGMMDVYAETGGGNVIAVYEVPRDQVHQYGIVGVGETSGKGFRISSISVQASVPELV